MIWPRALIVKIRFSLEEHHRFLRKLGHAMQNREPSTFEIWSGSVVGRQRSQQPARLWNFLKSDRDAVLVVREPFGDRARAAVLVTAAIVASFGLGWAGGLNWPQFANELGLVAVAQKEAPAPQISEARSSGKIEGARKTASASGFARHCRQHSQATRPVAGRCTPDRPRQMRALPLRSRCGSPRGGAGNQAGDDSRLDGRRCSGRHRGSGRS